MAIAFVHPREGVAPYAGGKLYFYDPGTATERNVYQDADLTSLHAQPVIANSAGVFSTIYLQPGAFKVRFEQASGALIYEQDNVDPGVGTGPGALPISAGGTGATNAVTARTNLGAASETDLTAAQDDIATIQSQIDASLVAGDTRLGLMAGRDTVRAVDLDDTEFGNVVAQYYCDLITGQRVTSSVIPGDSTIPQSGEGQELWSRTITPKFTNSIIIVRFNTMVGQVNTQFMTFALFDGGTNAVAVASSAGSSTALVGLSLVHQFSSWGTGSKTLSIRFGPSTGSGQININSSGSPTFGGMLQSSVEVLEIKGGPF